jgi:uncharacterized phiE125 gp8 family phage protein
MSVRVITAPEPIVTWESAKAHLRQGSDDEQDYVEGLIAAATAWIDGPGGWLGRALGPQLLEWRLDCWPVRDRFVLPFQPELEIVSVKYFDPTGVEQTWSFPTPLYFESLPAVRGRVGDIRVQYWAGYGKRDPQDATKWIAAVPAPIKQAILLLVGHWFYSRTAVNIGNSVSETPFAVDALLSPYRIWRV